MSEKKPYPNNLKKLGYLFFIISIYPFMFYIYNIYLKIIRESHNFPQGYKESEFLLENLKYENITIKKKSYY